MNFPDPQQYQDGVLFLRDTHKIVLYECAELEQLLADAQTRGVFQSFATRPEWNEVFDFFGNPRLIMSAMRTNFFSLPSPRMFHT